MKETGNLKLIVDNTKSYEEALFASTTRIFSQFGCARVASKILEGGELELSEVCHLLKRAPMPVLMRLSQLKRRSDFKGVRPVVLLPYLMWKAMGLDSRDIIHKAESILRSVPYSEVGVVLDRVDISEIGADGEETLSQISKIRRGVIMIGPSIESIMLEYEGRQADARKWLADVLRKLKASGFSRLRMATTVESLDLISSAGLESHLVTYIDHFTGTKSLAKEILRISKSGREIVSWSPGIARKFTGGEDAMCATAFRMLRVYAVASIMLRNVRYIKVSSRFLPYRLVGVARLFGANDLGYGSFDAFTQEQLGLPSINDIERCCGVD